MATNHTQNYQLNLWEPGDSFLRAEFNENSQKLDAALKAETDARTALAQTVSQKAEASALNALSQIVVGKGNCSIVYGSYVGTGEHGEAHPTVLDFAGVVNKPPKFLFILPTVPGFYMLSMRGIEKSAVYPQSKSTVDVYCTLTWSDTSVSWYATYNGTYQLNEKDKNYLYIALF